jgi:hypothetical protein
MNMKLPAIALLSLFAVAAAPPVVKPASASRYMVSVQIFDGKGLVAAPKLITAAGENATIRIGDAKQMFEMLVMPKAKNHFHVQGNLTQWTKSGMKRDDAATVTQADGKPRCITFDKVNVANGKTTPMHVDVIISLAH